MSKRIRDTYFASDNQLLTMALATRGPGFTQDQVVQAEWGMARELGIPITLHAGMARMAGRFAMVEQLDRLGLLGPDITYIHCNFFSDHEWKRVADTGGTISIAPQVELQMNHGWAPANKAREFDLEPSLSIDVVTTVPGDMFTQIRAVFASERARVNDVCWVNNLPTPENMLTARDVLEMATINGARVAGFADRVGSLTPGKKADVVVIDATAINVTPGPRPGRRGHAVRRCVQRRTRPGRWRVQKARFQAACRCRTRPDAGGERQGTTAGCRRRAQGRSRRRLMTPQHLVARAADAVWAPAAGALASATGYVGWAAVGPDSPAVHTGFGLGRLDPGGRLPWHVHSYEESLYLVEGGCVIQTPDGATRLGTGAYGLIPVGVPHALRNDGSETAVWAAMLGAGAAGRARHGHQGRAGPTGHPRAPRSTCGIHGICHYGQVSPEHMDPALQGQQHLAVSASMRTALLVYSGITLKMMIDSNNGSALADMFMVQYEPGGLASPHDHPLEETYLILEGRVLRDVRR